MLYYKSNGRRNIKYEKAVGEHGERGQGGINAGNGMGIGTTMPVGGSGGGTTSYVGP